MEWQKNYYKWKQFKAMDEDLKKELDAIKNDSELLEDSFYKYLEFGTGGIRGELGPGTNRMNIYIIRKVSEGLARYIGQYGEEAKLRGVVIAYDSRLKSCEFAMEAAKTLGLHKIKTYIFKTLRSTPELSFAVRYLNAYMGIVITASHNPPEYNGFKVYGEDGAQIIPTIAEKITAKVDEVEDELKVSVGSEKELKESGIINVIGNNLEQAYLSQLQKINLNHEVIKQVADDFKIVYSPLHGTGNVPIRKGLKALGFKHVYVVKEQELPDSNFSTVATPNPEEQSAFELAIRYGKKLNADMLLCTDPDADRLGVAVRNKQGNFIILSGNQIGALILFYLINEKQRRGKLDPNSVVLKTIVTSEIGRYIASSFGLKCIDTLTGFKFIGEKIKEIKKSKDKSFLFGFEESYGYLIGDFVRDKDAIQASMMIAEVGAYYKSKNMTLYDGLLEIFEQYGYFNESMKSYILKGKNGSNQINLILSSIRNNPPKEIAGKRVVEIEDYQKSKRFLILRNETEVIKLPKSNVLKYKLEDESWFCLRPSGTEPKIKFYFGVKDVSLEASKQALSQLEKCVLQLTNGIISLSNVEMKN